MLLVMFVVACRPLQHISCFVVSWGVETIIHYRASQPELRPPPVGHSVPLLALAYYWGGIALKANRKELP